MFGSTGSRPLVAWRYSFVAPGERAATTPAQVIYLDVGGTIAPGVIDHHASEGSVTCSAMLVVEQRELVYNHLLGPWLVRHEEGRIPGGAVWKPTLVLHHDPDFDALVAAFLVRSLVADGDLPRYAKALAGYALEVDQGRCPLPLRSLEGGIPDFDPSGLDAIHLAYLAIQCCTGPEGRELSSGEKLALGFELLGSVIQDISQTRGDGPRALKDFFPDRRAWLAGARTNARTFCRLAGPGLELFRGDFHEGRIFGSVLLPAADERTCPVRAFVAGARPRAC